MATADQEQHPKGILKNSSSFEHSHGSSEPKKERGMKWDEMNILSTYHPADKDYGHMKITDPPTPYNYDNVEDEDEDLDPDSLATRLQGMKQTKVSPRPGGESDDSEEDEALTGQAQEHKQFFEQKRKMHYNEFQAVKLARKLMEEDEEEDGEDSSTPTSTSEAPVATAAQTTSTTTSTQSTSSADTSQRQQ